MKKLLSEKTRSDLTKLGIYQIAGGSIGIFLVIWALYKDMNLSWLTVLLYIIILAFFFFSVFCGFLCADAKPNALKLSFINQLLQVVGFAAFGFAFSYVAGLYVSVGVDLTESFDLSFVAGISKIDLRVNNGSSKMEVGINIVGLLIVIWIDRLMKRAKSEIELKKISDLGEEKYIFK